MIGENIRKLRKHNKISINKLSKSTGISLGYLSDLENNKATNPSTETLNKIANFFNVPLSVLVGDQDNVVTDEIYSVSQFSGELSSLSEEERKAMISEILREDPAIYYAKNDTASKENSLINVSMLPTEARDELNSFLSYLKYKYKISE